MKLFNNKKKRNNNDFNTLYIYILNKFFVYINMNFCNNNYNN